MPIILNTDKLTEKDNSGTNAAYPVKNDDISNTTVYFDELIILSDHKTNQGNTAKKTLETLQKSAQKYRTQKNSQLKIQHFESASDAIYHIISRKDEKNHYVSLLLCDYVLDDFDAGLIISLLRLHPLGELFPVIVTLNTDLLDEHHREFWMNKSSLDDENFWKTAKLNLKTLGAVGFLEYPYSLENILDCCDTFIEKFAETEAEYYLNIIDLENASKEDRAMAEKANKEQLKKFEKGFVRFFYTPDENASYEELFLVGKQKYYDRLYNQATRCFEHSSEHESVYQADSLAYLFAIHKEQRKQATAKIYLERAFNAYTYDENWDKVRKSAQIFSKEFPDQKSPLFSAMQKHFAHGNHQTINMLIEHTKDIIPLQEIGDYLVQLNGSKKLPPVITAFVERNRELKEIIFKSNLKETVLDGDEYIRQQEEQRTLQRLELQWKSRVSGEVAENRLREKYGAANSETTVMNFSRMSCDTDNSKDTEHKKQSDTETIARTVGKFETEAVKNGLKNRKEHNSFSDKKSGQKDSDSPDPKNDRLAFQASKIGTKSKATIDPIPTIMLDGGNGSFWGDIMNMAKFTKFISKNKKQQ